MVNRHRQGGFTLIEVLIALVIVSVSFAAMIYSIHSSTNNLIHLEDKVGASWVADNVVAQVRLGLLNGATEGSETEWGQRYYWSISEKTTENTKVKEMTVAVSLKRYGRPELVVTAYREETEDAS